MPIGACILSESLCYSVIRRGEKQLFFRKFSGFVQKWRTELQENTQTCSLSYVTMIPSQGFACLSMEGSALKMASIHLRLAEISSLLSDSLDTEGALLVSQFFLGKNHFHWRLGLESSGKIHF